MSEFEFVSLVRQVNGDGPDGSGYGDAPELIRRMRANPVWGDSFRCGVEHFWKTDARRGSEVWIELLVRAARYLSDLIGADVPVLAPREVVDASIGVARPTDADTLLVGKAVQRAIRTQLSNQSQEMTNAILTEIQRLMDGAAARALPPNSKLLDTEQVAARLQVSEVTVARLFKRGLLIGSKTAGNQWRTTEEQLRRSPYLNGKKGRGGGNGKLE